MKDIYVLDASGYLYRSYFAIKGMTNHKGESTNALFGFIRSIKKLIKDFNPNYLIAVFDGPQCSKKRKDIYPEYKANRTAMPQDLRYQIQWAQNFCDLIGIPKLVIPEVEADDTMGSIATWWPVDDSKILLCTSDKDMAQLVNNRVKLLNTHKENLLLGPEGVEDKYGVPPNQIIDWLAIMGDSSDNVPGVPGFGPKKATTLLQTYGSLDNIINNVDGIPGKKNKETFAENLDLVKLSRTLVTIDTSVEFPKDVDFFKIKEPDYQHLKTFYTEMNFSTLSKELEQDQNKGSEEELNYQLVDDTTSLQKLIDTLSKQKEICVDTETTGTNPLEAELVGVGFCYEPKTAWYIPTNGNLGLEAVIKAIKPLLENSKIGFYGHNVKYDKHILANNDIRIANICFDTILASYVLNSHSRQHSLDALTLELFGKVKTPIQDLIGRGTKQITMRGVLIETASNYCCEDVDYTCRLKNILEEQLHERKLEKLFFKLELPLMSVLTTMERHGIFLDLPCLEAMRQNVNGKVQQYAQEIQEMAGEEFNLNSPKQLGTILYEKLNISPPPRSKTKTGYSTNAEVLENLSVEYPIAQKILEYRSVEKLRSTYIEALPNTINPHTHRIHPTFNQSLAATGRLTCHDPNLQNIPLHSEVGSRIRSAFRPEKTGWSYLAADYSQIELRLLAHLSQDPTLLHAFNNNEDIHAHTASIMFGTSLDEVSSDQRYQAKAINFGIIYGQGSFGLSRQLKITVQEAAEFIDKYFKRYNRVKDFLESCKEKARQTGKAVTVTGRERALPEINSKNGQIRASAERLAVNTPFQGTAADIIKLAMLEVDRQLKKEQSIGYMILQIHDELMFEVPDFELIDVERIVRSSMEGVMKLKVPLIVDIGVGKNWKEC